MEATTPRFDALNQNVVLNIAEKILGQFCTALCLPRNSYINRVYECELAPTRERFILKFYRPDRWSKEQILEEHAFLKRLAEDDISVILPMTIHNKTLHEHEGFYVAIFPKLGGRALDEFTEDLYKEVGRLLARVHVSSKPLTLKHRQTWHPANITKDQLDIILRDGGLSPDYETAMRNAVTQAIQRIEPLFEGLELQTIHGDCHFGNMIYRPNEGLFLLDFDDCVTGPLIQDIWMLLPNQSENDEQELRWIAEGYSLFADFPYHQLKLIPALRAMRQIHFMAWCATQCNEAHFKHHFPDWGSTRYWNEAVRELLALSKI